MSPPDQNDIAPTPQLPPGPVRDAYLEGYRAGVRATLRMVAAYAELTEAMR